MVRYRFSEFTLSPQRRMLLRHDAEVPLIPRYFDLLLLLIERRREAVHRREIFDRVWGDVTVSESALSQAVRTIRRTLEDDPREPRFIRTVSRHGYQFVFPDVIEEEEEHVPRLDGMAAASRMDVNPIDEPSATLRAARGSTAASAGAAIAGVATGGIGGVLLVAAPGSTAPIAIIPVLMVIGGLCGALGGGGVGAGVAFGDTAPRAHRTLRLTLAAALGGGLVGAAVQWLSRWALDALVGIDLGVGGTLEGIVIGGAAGLGFAMAAIAENGVHVPRYGHRVHAAFIVAICCGLAGLALTLTGHPLAAGTIHRLADAAEGSRATLAPLARLVGERDFGPLSGAIFGFVEGSMFGFGCALGLLRPARRRSPQSHPTLTPH